MFRIAGTVALAFISLTINLATAAPLPKAWNSWAKQAELQLQQKDSGIRDAAQYHDRVCPTQSTDQKKEGCRSAWQVIIDRRNREKIVLSGMINLLNKLPLGEATALLKIVEPAYNNMIDGTTQRLNAAKERYPQRQASR